MANIATFRGAFVCIFNKSFSEVLLLNRNWKKKKQEGKFWEGEVRWGNVGGSIEPGETPRQACMREAEEEIGVRLDPRNLVPVYVKKSPASEPHPYIVHFYATSIDKNTKISINDESDRYEWFSLGNLPDGMLDSKEDVLMWQNSVKKRVHDYG